MNLNIAEETHTCSDGIRSISSIHQFPYCMDHNEIYSICACISLYKKSIKVLEWGSGNSTLYFPKFLPEGSHWYAIEHNIVFTRQVKAKLKENHISNITLTYVGCNRPYSDGVDDGDFETFRDYVLYPKKYSQDFNIILVDGRARVDCMKIGWQKLDHDGIMILHDAQRKQYQNGFPLDGLFLKIINKREHIEGFKTIAFICKSLNRIERLYKTVNKVVDNHIILEKNFSDGTSIKNSGAASQPEVSNKLVGQKKNSARAKSHRLNWNKVKSLKQIKLYAGDIPNKKEYSGLIGLSIARNDHKHILHDITKPFPIPDNSVDSFQVEDVLEHVNYNKLLPIINEIYRVLKPNGVFRLSLPDYGCDLLIKRSFRDKTGNIIFDPGGGGIPSDPGHLWHPRIDQVKYLIEKSNFNLFGKVEYLHYYSMDGTFIVQPIDYSKGHVQRTPDFDQRVQNPYRPMSMVIDLLKSDMKSNNIKEKQSIQERSQSDNIKIRYETLWEKKLNDPIWLKNDGKGRVEYCANFLNSNFKFNGNTKLLDIGCGRGTLAYYLNSKMALYGIDISETAIAQAKKNYTRADQINLDQGNLPYDNNYFDFVIVLDVIEHVYDPLSLINEMHRVLKNDGKLILSTPNILYEKYIKDFVRTRRFPKTSCDEFPYDGGHIHFFTFQDMFDLMCKTGFKTKPIGANRHQFDYEFKESTIWIIAEKM